jgi:hypothetical protein
MNAAQSTRRWQQCREAITDLAAAREVPREQFPGHKEIYCSNLEGFLGGQFPALLRERDELAAEVTRLREAREGTHRNFSQLVDWLQRNHPDVLEAWSA